MLNEVVVKYGAVNELKAYLGELYTKEEILILSGRSFSKGILTEYNLDSYKTHVVSDFRQSTLARLEKTVNLRGITTVVAFGGGSIQDYAKRLSFLYDKALISAPTIISNDGLCSPIAVLPNDQNKKESLKGKVPKDLFIDLSFIEAAPFIYLKSAQGDLLTNLSACNDWELAYEMKLDKLSSYALFLSKQSAFDVLLFDNGLEQKDLFKRLIHCQLLSGKAMSIAGTSRPCSGSEHLLSHAIDYLNYGKDILHGLQVASISLFTLFLQEDLRPRYLLKASQLEIEMNWLNNLAAVPDRKLLKEIFRTAVIMRPNRYTILDRLDENSFVDKVEEFSHFIDVFK